MLGRQPRDPRRPHAADPVHALGLEHLLDTRRGYGRVRGPKFGLDSCFISSTTLRTTSLARNSGQLRMVDDYTRRNT